MLIKQLNQWQMVTSNYNSVLGSRSAPSLLSADDVLYQKSATEVCFNLSSDSILTFDTENFSDLIVNVNALFFSDSSLTFSNPKLYLANSNIDLSTVEDQFIPLMWGETDLGAINHSVALRQLQTTVLIGLNSNSIANSIKVANEPMSNISPIIDNFTSTQTFEQTDNIVLSRALVPDKLKLYYQMNTSANFVEDTNAVWGFWFNVVGINYGK